MSSRLVFWWWGEDEAPGLSAWVGEAASSFEGERGIEVALRRLRHDEVLTRLPAAAASEQPPDLHFFWNGMYHVDFVWQGLVEPLDGLLTTDELAAFGGGPQSQVDGRTYRAAWYVIPVVWVANRDLLARVGICGLPDRWEAFVDACARVRAAGLVPITAGDGEGDLSVWWLTHFLTQALDAPTMVPRLALGELDWRDERFAYAWRLLAEVRDASFLDENALPLTLWEGLEQFNEGRSAFTLASGPMFASCRRALGEAVTVMTAPRALDGPLSGLPIVDTQGIGICSGASSPSRAADFLRTLFEPARRQRLWDDVELFPADHRWAGPDAAADADYRMMWSWYAHGPRAPYLPNLLPLELHYTLAAGVGQAVLAGQLAAENAGEAAREHCARWRTATDVDRYRAWALAAAG